MRRNGERPPMKCVDVWCPLLMARVMAAVEEVAAAEMAVVRVEILNDHLPLNGTSRGSVTVDAMEVIDLMPLIASNLMIALTVS